MQVQMDVMILAVFVFGSAWTERFLSDHRVCRRLTPAPT
jgi:hypothetical protein